MKILVAVKRVLDANVPVRIRADGLDVETSGARMSINPFDEVALEEAVRLKERGSASEVVAVALGTAANQDILRHALALGADRAVQIEAPAGLQPLGVAKLLQAVVARETPDLVLIGKQAVDDDAGQEGQMLAALLGWPQATFVSALQIENQALQAVREVDGGTETLALPLPAVVTADLRLNEPRFIKLPSLMLARKKPIETLSADELGVDLAPRLTVTALSEPPARGAGRLVADAAELVECLQIEGRRLEIKELS